MLGRSCMLPGTCMSAIVCLVYCLVMDGQGILCHTYCTNAGNQPSFFQVIRAVLSKIE